MSISLKQSVYMSFYVCLFACVCVYVSFSVFSKFLFPLSCEYSRRLPRDRSVFLPTAETEIRLALRILSPPSAQSIF